MCNTIHDPSFVVKLLVKSQPSTVVQEVYPSFDPSFGQMMTESHYSLVVCVSIDFRLFRH